MRTGLAAIVAAICTLWAAHAKAEETDLILQGLAGRYPVVLHLSVEEDGAASATYFYKRFRQDIGLQGKSDAGRVDLTSDETGDHFELRHTGDGYDGSLTLRKGSRLPVRLSPVAKGSVPDPLPDLSLPQTDDYERLRLTGLPLTPGKQETVAGRYGIQWFDEPLSGVSMFRVVSGYPAAAMVAINRVLARRQYTEIATHFGCVGSDGTSGVDGSSLSSRFLNDRWVSFSWESGWFCAGNAHPDFGISGTTLDARSGQELGLEDILWFGTGARPQPDTDDWYAYRDKVFAPAVVALFEKLHPDEMKPGGDDCNYDEAGVWSFAPWYLTDKGLYLGAYFPRVEKACDNPEWSVVPWTTLKALNPALFPG